MPRAGTQESPSSDLSLLQSGLGCISILFSESIKPNPKDLTTCLRLWSAMVVDKNLDVAPFHLGRHFWVKFCCIPWYSPGWDQWSVPSWCVLQWSEDCLTTTRSFIFDLRTFVQPLYLSSPGCVPTFVMYSKVCDENPAPPLTTGDKAAGSLSGHCLWDTGFRLNTRLS